MNFVKIILTVSLMNKHLLFMVKFLTNPRIQYKEYECLSECKLCNKTPYAKVNGQIISGENTQDLLNQLQNDIKINTGQATSNCFGPYFIVETLTISLKL